MICFIVVYLCLRSYWSSLTCCTFLKSFFAQKSEICISIRDPHQHQCISCFWDFHSAQRHGVTAVHLNCYNTIINVPQGNSYIATSDYLRLQSLIYMIYLPAVTISFFYRYQPVSCQKSWLLIAHYVNVHHSCCKCFLTTKTRIQKQIQMFIILARNTNEKK